MRKRRHRGLPTWTALAMAVLAGASCGAATAATVATASPAGADSLRVRDRLVDFGHEPRATARRIDTIVIHSSYDALGPLPYDLDGLLAEYRQYGVAPHYVIDRAGTIWRTVRDRDVAWHAGRSRLPDGRTAVNAVSLGIEMMTTKSDSLTGAQYAALNGLLVRLRSLYPIRYVLGHSEIAPGRKDDPWNFDFSRLDSLRGFVK